MKHALKSIILLAAFLPALSACGEADYSSRISEARSDLFCAETEEFSVVLSCVSREYPYLADGIPCERSMTIEIVLNDAQGADGYSVAVTGENGSFGGDMTYRNVRDDFFYSCGVKQFPQTSVVLRVEWEGGSREISATSVRNERTLSVEEALNAAVAAKKDYVTENTAEGEFEGEFYVRLLRRDKNYYYVGIIDKAGRTLSLLLDAETGALLAERLPE